jgi:hypothetical protein
MQTQDMRLSRYTDGPAYEELTIPLAGSLQSPEPCAVYIPRTPEEFDAIAQRLPTSFLVYVAPYLTPAHEEELAALHRETKVPVVVANLELVPELATAFGKRAPLFAKMYKLRVLRFLEREPTRSNVCSFAVSERQWRAQSLRA